MSGARTKRWIPALLAALVAFVVFLEGRGYPWSLALLAGAAVGSLVYFIVLKAEVLRWHLRREPPLEASGEEPAAPRNATDRATERGSTESGSRRPTAGR